MSDIAKLSFVADKAIEIYLHLLTSSDKDPWRARYCMIRTFEYELSQMNKRSWHAQRQVTIYATAFIVMGPATWRASQLTIA
jgi:hypothetical protein